MENLFNFLNFREKGAFGETEFSFQIGNILIQAGSIRSETKEYKLIYPIPYKHEPKILISEWYVPSNVIGHSGRSKTECPFFTTGNVIALDWITVGIV